MESWRLERAFQLWAFNRANRDRWVADNLQDNVICKNKWRRLHHIAYLWKIWMDEPEQLFSILFHTVGLAPPQNITERGGYTHKCHFKNLSNKYKHIKFKLVKKCQTQMRYCIICMHWFCRFLTLLCPRSGFITLIWNYISSGTALTTLGSLSSFGRT